MSGILKRKLEEAPPPYLSVKGSDEDEVSCSDSGNSSSNSLNHPVASELLDCKITAPHKVIFIIISAQQAKLCAFNI